MHILDNLPESLADCRYCSQVSKANGEDPIGSAPQIDYWLIVEVPQPWPITMATDNPAISQIFPLIKKLIFGRGVIVRPIAIAPDPDYSTPGFTRVLYYSRPAKQFAKYLKEEYLVPEALTIELVLGLLNRLLGKKNPVKSFATYQQETQHIREMLVCTHTQVDLACGRFGTPIYRQLRKQFGQSHVRVWQSTHFGGHQFAPTLIDLPTGQFWGHLESGLLTHLMQRSGDQRQLALCYRGWAGVNKFEQMAERAVWQQEGWDWFNCPRTVKTTSKGLTGIKKLAYPILKIIPIKLLQLWLDRWTKGATWVNMSVSYETSSGTGIYKVTVKEKDEIISAGSSATEANQTIKLKPVKQYQVVHSVKIV
ncbi:sucrase ferredoxin [Leptolyngbyaceae cyanobacterium CCMR0082]|uniref:Sucrase ferredoxin n=1 Tax=Adonisia turfae CCMR0082 TaxID=2304604 RepID=A0A6M0S8E3_9CYAN|nr:sucrase ferredoxin [Adonisia turfae]NEZ64737.1 sucrase ferredoxin [Adonisia turfae CCMR0082]